MIQVASRGDFSVSFGLNTAGFLAEMSKTPNLFWDPLYSKISFNYNSKYTNLKNIYRSSDDLIKDLEKFLNNNKRPNYTIKNIKLYNYYNDSLSNKRVGQYINDYLAEIKNYKSKRTY